MTKPASFLRETPNYWVLAEYPSKSEPGKTYEVRTSKNDEKTYCTCRGWVVKLNQSKATGRPAICKHIAMYKASKPAQTVVIMDFESFARVRRGITISNKSVGDDITVRRS